MIASALGLQGRPCRLRRSFGAGIACAWAWRRHVSHPGPVPEDLTLLAELASLDTLTTDRLMSDSRGTSGSSRGAVPPVPAASPWGAVVARFSAAGHGRPDLLEVLEQEAEDRRQRRISRLRTASRLPAGKTWETFEHDRVLGLSLRQQWGNWPTAASSTAASTSWPSVFPAPGKHTPCAPCASGWWSLTSSSKARSPTGHNRLVQDLLAVPSGLGSCRVGYATASQQRVALLDDLGYLPQGAVGVGAALRPHRRTLRAPVPGHHVQPGLLHQ